MAAALKKIGDAHRGKARKPQVEGWSPVICSETNSWFSSISEAFRRCGFKSKNSIDQALKLGSKARGFHWKYSTKKEFCG